MWGNIKKQDGRQLLLDVVVLALGAAVGGHVLVVAVLDPVQLEVRVAGPIAPAI